MKNKIKALKRDQELFDDTERLVAERGNKRKQLLKSKDNKIQELQKALAAAVHKSSTTEYQLNRKFSKQVENLQVEVHGLRQLIKLKSKELKNMKSLAQTILDQRSETEQFFIDALQKVKAEQDEMKLTAALQRTADFNKRVRRDNSVLRFPSVKKESKKDEAPKNTSFKVRYGDLKPKQKERVLEVLFAKINNRTRELRIEKEAKRRAEAKANETNPAKMSTSTLQFKGGSSVQQYPQMA